MSTPTVTTLERVSDIVVEGIISVVAADGANFSLPAYGPRATQAMAINRLEVMAGGFFRASDQMNFSPAGEAFYNHRRGFVTATVITQRQGQTNLGSATQHGMAIGRFRWLMTRLAQKLTPTAMGGYQVVDVIDMGDSSSENPETETDRTSLRFQIDLVIPPANYSDS